ncbi:MAG: c-type cytochrome [Chloroflexota bacterium]
MKNTTTPPKIVALALLVFVGAVMLGYGVSRLSAQEPQGNPVTGGLLYDKWWTVTGADAPVGDHPLWATQSTNTRTGADTWRCKECHGWDYKGADGAYGSGSHFTGFPGILASKGQPVADIVAALKGSTNPDHDFSAVLDGQALLDLAVFVSESLIDTAPLVNADKTATGDAARGQAFFAMCTACHGPQGNAIYFDSFEDPLVIGSLSSDNPWEFIHKARYGQPTFLAMPALYTLGLADSDVGDVLAYAQSLPGEPALSGGGLLYDKWWTVTGADAPTENHPLWATQSTNTRTGADTWRCKECHGWDYKGADGAYGSGSHFTGFPGILDATSKSSEELLAWLNGEANPDHDFSVVVDEMALDALVAFIQQEMFDISMYVNEDGTVAGDADAGRSLYAGTCARCHGADGKIYNFGSEDKPEYVGTLAVDNPWEVFHKVAVGQPGAPMPGALALGWTPQQIADVVAFAQTLPVE